MAENQHPMGIWSTGDRYTGEQQMQETAKYMAADFRYERVENSTHWTMLDQPEGSISGQS